MWGPIFVFPYGNFALAKLYHSATAWADVVETVHYRLAVATLVKCFRTLALWIVNRCPRRWCFAEDLLSNENPRRRAIADAPRVEPSGNVEIWCLGRGSDKWQAIWTV